MNSNSVSHLYLVSHFKLNKFCWVGRKVCLWTWQIWSSDEFKHNLFYELGDSMVSLMDTLICLTIIIYFSLAWMLLGVVKSMESIVRCLLLFYCVWRWLERNRKLMGEDCWYSRCSCNCRYGIILRSNWCLFNVLLLRPLFFNILFFECYLARFHFTCNRRWWKWTPFTPTWWGCLSGNPYDFYRNILDRIQICVSSFVSCLMCLKVWYHLVMEEAQYIQICMFSWPLFHALIIYA